MTVNEAWVIENNLGVIITRALTPTPKIVLPRLVFSFSADTGLYTVEWNYQTISVTPTLEACLAATLEFMRNKQ